MPGCEILQQYAVYEDLPATNVPKKDASCRIGEETHIWCFLDEMLLSRLLFLWQILTCFLIRLITQIQSPFSFRQVAGQPRTCLSDHVLRTPTVHPHGLVITAADDKAAIGAEADGGDRVRIDDAMDLIACGSLLQPLGLVLTAADDKAAIGADAHGSDRHLMAHPGDLLPRGTSADPPGLVLTAADDKAAIGAEADGG